MKFYDISVPISSDTPVSPGDTGAEIAGTVEIGPDSPYSLAKLVLGGHIDPPVHFFSQGLAVDQLPPDVFIGPATVVEMSQRPGGDFCLPAMAAFAFAGGAHFVQDPQWGPQGRAQFPSPAGRAAGPFRWVSVARHEVAAIRGEGNRSVIGVPL